MGRRLRGGGSIRVEDVGLADSDQKAQVFLAFKPAPGESETENG